MTEFLAHAGGRLGYDDSGGAGPLVVCVPGMGELRTIYRFVVPRLRDAGFRVVTVDVRGLGDSTAHWSDYSDTAIASDLAALIAALAAGPATVIGNSIAGSSAVCVAADYPELIAKLVLVTPVTRSVPPTIGSRIGTRLALAWPWGAGAWVGYQAGKLYPARKPADHVAYEADLKRNLRETGRLRAFRRMAFDWHRSAEARLGSVRCPTLVVMGAADPDFPDPSAEGKHLAGRLGAELVVLPGLGHFPQAEDPEAFWPPVDRFLRGPAHGA